MNSWPDIIFEKDVDDSIKDDSETIDEAERQFWRQHYINKYADWHEIINE